MDPVTPRPRDAATLVIRLPNWVGDACMALPALQQLAAAGHPLHLLGRGWAADLFAGTPWPVTVLPKRGAVAAIRAVGCGQGLVFTNSFGSAWQFRRAGVRATGRRRGLEGWLRSPLLARNVTVPAGLHEVEVFLRVAGAVTGTMDLPTQTALPLHQRHRATAQEALVNAGVSGAYTVLCPLAAGTIKGRSKCWPSFPLLCRLLRDEGRTVVACPGPGEEALSTNLLPGATVIPGTRLGTYAAILAGAQAVVANDSGPMHLAAAVGAPVVGIFGVSDPGRTRPWATRAVTVGTSQAWPPLGQVVAALARVE